MLDEIYSEKEATNFFWDTGMDTSYNCISDENYRRLAEEYVSQIKRKFGGRLRGVLLYGSVAKGTNKILY